MAYNCPLGGYSFGGGYVGMIFGTIIQVLIIAGIVWLVVYLINNRKKNSADSLEILKERYAKGEINKPEYENMKKELRLEK